MRNILIVGDSHAEGYLPHSKIRSNAIAEAVGALPELRLAVSGSTAIDWARDLDGRLTRAEAHSYGCEAALVSLLGNDLFAASADGNVTVAEIAASIAALYEVLHTLSGLPQRLFVLLYGQPFQQPTPEQARGLALLNEAITACANTVALITGNPIEFIDESKILDASDWPGDDIHPFESGYRKIGAELLRRLDAARA